jgi:hypothetical protein
LSSSTIKFSYTVIGETREEVLEEIDKNVRETITAVTGEPWVVMSDTVKKVPTGHEPTGPHGFFYVAEQEVVFGGPNLLAKDALRFRDGFRPQSDPDSEGY